MDQQKIGRFLKDLRKEKNLTQEQLAERFQISRRTVSRWETGSNLPDLDILIEMADYYDVDLRELLDGERKSEKMNKELEETVLKVADYSNEEKQKLTKRMHWLFIGGFIAAVIYVVLVFTDHSNNFLGGMCLGITFGMMIVGVIMTSKYAARIRAYKMRLLHRQ
ncbi:MAG: helix-turn-helix domain-containing protein [Dorea sp.]|uniref:helix-turn-helix domain-containing protein n=1 Tax=Dorea sp. YH-dor226 TaxID=3151119 RepID=UPI0030428909|nr:helix-turn-helix domain-containing protein [Dorea sp.]